MGELPDASEYGDEGSNTLRTLWRSGQLNVPNLTQMGLFNIEGNEYAEGVEKPTGSFARLAEISKGKDTTTGHWEIAGLISERPFPTYPDGFPKEIIDAFEKATGKKVLCNKPYSGTEVIDDYGEEHLRTGALIVYTSADSVFQVAANEEVVPVEELYRYCRIARDLLKGEHAVARVIARPFIGSKKGGFIRTPNRHDFSLEPQGETILDILTEEGINTVGVGKIYDIFAGRGVQKSIKMSDNVDGMNKTIKLVQEREQGFIFVNLVDFDMKYGHRNNIAGYTEALNTFDMQLKDLLESMQSEDILIITADHGCDPGTPSTDHSREYVPMLIYGESIKRGVDLGTRPTFSDIAATVAEIFKVKPPASGESFYSLVKI
ncbi:MAG TPA: phosphopentomutase [Clostridiaceae bacterium]|nr:phosphopentomutase [Clostridiaceae bacterium]